MMNAARKTFVAKTKFHGLSGSGYAIDNISILGTLIISAHAFYLSTKPRKNLEVEL